MQQETDPHSNIAEWEIHEVIQTVPLVQASRIVRAEADGCLDYLLKILEQKADEYIKNMENANNMLQ